jgi:hypothetical protein
MTLAIFFTGVLARECARNSLTCSLVYGTRTGFLAVLGTMVPMVDGDNALSSRRRARRNRVLQFVPLLISNFVHAEILTTTGNYPKTFRAAPIATMSSATTLCRLGPLGRPS